MKKIVFGFAAALVCAAFVITEAGAARLGGARSVGAQRSISNAPPAAAPAKPAQAQQAAPAASPASSPTTAPPQPVSGFAKWAPLLGGLALGGALGWLLGANGMGGLLVGVMLVALLIFAAVFVVRLLTQKRGEAPQRMQYAAAGSQGPYPAMGMAMRP